MMGMWNKVMECLRDGLPGRAARYGVLAFAISPAGMPVWAQMDLDIRLTSSADCTFRSGEDPAAGRDMLARVTAFAKSAGSRRGADAGAIAVRNFIDEAIFPPLAKAGIPVAALTTDVEFLRRVTLDLTGRIPTPADVRAFAEDGDPNKRSRLIEKLLYSPEAGDRWTIWLGDLFGNTINTVNINRQAQGRNVFYDWIRGSLGDGKSLKDMAYDAVIAGGNNYQHEYGAVNYILAGRHVMGPAQDWYDLMLYQAAEKFLGLGHYDCLLCHDGRRHLDDLSLWGKSVTRVEAQRMAAFFSRISITSPNNRDRDDPLFNSFLVTDRTTGNYALGTTFGNRPNRPVVGTLRSLDAEYRDGGKPGSANWRTEFAEKMTRDPLFAINFANRLWKAMFGYGLVEPVHLLDPARLDPDNPPPAGWQLQASHPELLVRLASELTARNFQLREFLRLLAESSAYQLSSAYDAPWNTSMAPLFARHYPRRLEGEEIHDAIVQSTGVFQQYTVNGWPGTVQWASRLPDPQEPRSNGAVANFMNVFLRGNRDTVPRSQAGSILQELYLMNDGFVTNRTRVTASPVLQEIARLTPGGRVVEELYLTFLGRMPSAAERAAAEAHMARGTTAALRNTMIEDLAWALINKPEFIFSY